MPHTCQDYKQARKPFAPKIEFREADQADLGRPVPSPKIFRFSLTPNQLYNPRRPALMRGVGHRHERWGGMRWTRQRRARKGSLGGSWPVSDDGAPTNDAENVFARARRAGTRPGEGLASDGSRTVKSCGPDASWLASSLAEAKPAQPGGQPSSTGRR
jgi:hypothetical protein